MFFSYLKYFIKDYKIQREVKKRYYKSQSFREVDKGLLEFYLFQNPYQISRRYLKRARAKDIHVYGETPLMTFEKVAKEANICKDDVVLELGSGRGRGALFLNDFFKCQVIGVERIPHFVKIARHITHKHQVKGVEFLCHNFTQADVLANATCIYLYGTCLEDLEITELIETLKKCSKGTRIVTVSYPLTDYDKDNRFLLEKSFSVSFPWGETEAYLQTVR